MCVGIVPASSISGIHLDCCRTESFQSEPEFTACRWSPLSTVQVWQGWRAGFPFCEVSAIPTKFLGTEGLGHTGCAISFLPGTSLESPSSIHVGSHWW